MKAEIRADGLHISGYVNVPGRQSRPVITPRGKVVEVIEQRAFQRAIEKTGNIDMMLDHEKKIASTSDGTLKVHEDEVGLRAESVVTDLETIQGAREGKLRGWSFKMVKVKDEVEERAGQLPLRTIKDFYMPEITIAYRKQPVYASTSIELRAEEEEEVELRATEDKITVTDMVETPKKPGNLSEYQNRINKLKVGK